MIRQFDVVPNPSEVTGSFVRYAVVLSSHHLEETGSIVLAPLTNDLPLTRVDVVVEFEGARLTLAVAELMSVDSRRIAASRGNLSVYEDDIRRALERVFSGF